MPAANLELRAQENHQSILSAAPRFRKVPLFCIFRGMRGADLQSLT
jgi:hypothetical protein